MITDVERREFLNEIERVNAMIRTGELTVDEQMSITRTVPERK